jgi:DegV family protein with EDD domain
MSRIAIVSDSAANLPVEYLDRYKIHTVPLILHLDRATFRDGVDILPHQVYDRLRTGNSPMVTSAPSIGDFVRLYASLAASGDDIISIHTSSRLSAIYQAARMASEMIDNAHIEIVDSGSAAMGQGFVVLEAARLAAAGADKEAILRRVAQVVARVDIIATLSDLQYLVRSGRVPAAVGLAGSLLKICPIFRLRNGQAQLLEIRRTRQNAIQHIVDLVAKEVDDHPVHLAVFHGQSPQEAEHLKDAICRRVTCVEALISEFTPAMAVHTGPDVLGAAFFTED